jgi:hypothetical protein
MVDGDWLSVRVRHGTYPPLFSPTTGRERLGVDALPPCR